MQSRLDLSQLRRRCIGTPPSVNNAISKSWTDQRAHFKADLTCTTVAASVGLKSPSPFEVKKRLRRSLFVLCAVFCTRMHFWKRFLFSCCWFVVKREGGTSERCFFLSSLFRGSKTQLMYSVSASCTG